MVAMNILYINHYAGSPSMGMEFRTYYLSEEWKNMGHSVVIVAGDYSHLRIKNPVVGKDFAEENVDGVDYCWVQTGKYDGNGAKRAFSMFRFVYKLYVNAKMLVDRYKPDVVITSSTYPIDTFAGQRIARLAGAKLIHEIHDMWPETLVQIGNMSRLHPFVMLMQWGENSFCRNSDAVVSLLPCAKNYLIAHGMGKENFFHVPNGVVISEWECFEDLPDEHRKIFDHLHKENRFVIGFFGSHTPSYCLDYLIEAVRCLRCENIAVVLVGSGNYKEKLIESAEDLEDTVYFLKPIKKNSIPALTREFDAIYVGAVDNAMFSFGICMNKLFDSMMAGKPILYAVNAPNNYIAEYNCGVSLMPESVDDLVEGIRKLMKMTEKERFEMGYNGHVSAVKHFDYRVIAKNFADIMNDVVRK